MAPPRGRKRKSNESTMSNNGEQHAHYMAGSPQKVPTKTGSPSQHQECSPAKRRKQGTITLAQKQALIDNLQLEITERARKLRANYNIHAQSLRTRIEIRVNRIPISLRKVKMGDLLQKYSTDQPQQQQSQQSLSQYPRTALTSGGGNRGPPVPAKDAVTRRPPLPSHVGGSASPMRLTKRLSHEISSGDKENDVEHILENPKKKARGGAHAGPASADIMRNPGQILSPTSSNSRIAPRERERVAPTPVAKGPSSGIARPVSPTKMAGGGGLISNMVEKARSTRAAATARKTTTSTTASSSNGGTTRTRRAAPAPAPPPVARPATRRRASGTSESSDGSTSTVVRKRPGTAMSTTAPKAAPAKRTVMSTIRKGVVASTTKKAPAAKAALAATTGTGRVLRKRA
ncbi:Borealin N terminal-domain-containing protein [Podospora didyma]|uniref:Borealin N terminal-domain-containing protein n=1 Tax=Podospora didyma TaxID=330526 RepID=A0AAE0P640_9PEZI|nr:Borealin N terminal-domain-containing protein [Podospora didyma]